MVWDADELSRAAGAAFGVTGAVGSDASIDASNEVMDANEIEAAAAKTLSEAEALLQEHPDYKDNAPKWEKYLNLYTSTNLSKYIFRHFRESDDKYAQRVERLYFYNYVKSVVELFTAFLFHHPVDRVPTPAHKEDYEEIYKDFDRAGTQVVTFFQEVCNYAQVEGQVGILVDMPKLDQELESEQQRMDMGHRPFCTLIHSEQIKDWEVDEHGNFLWVKLEVFRPVERSWLSSAGKQVKHFQIWDKEKFQVWKVEKSPESAEPETATLVDEGTHGLGVVPLVIARLEKGMHPWFGVSAVTDISDINIGILNWSSLGDEEIYERCLNILAMEAGDDGMPIQVGNGNLLEFPNGASPPFYLEPGATPLERIQAWINHGKDEIRRLAKINLSAGLGDVRQASSGIAKAFSFIETNQSLAAKALNMEQVEMKVHYLIDKYLGKDIPSEVTIEYPREFGVEDWLMLYQELGQARVTLTSPTAIRELEKNFTNKLFSRKSVDFREKIAEEIDQTNVENSATLGNAFGITPIGTSSNGLNQPENTALEPPHQADPGMSN